MDGDNMFLSGQREKYFDPTQSEKNHENDPPQPQNKNHHDTKNKELIMELEENKNKNDDNTNEDEDVGQNEVLKNPMTRWPAPIPYVLSNTLPSSM